MTYLALIIFFAVAVGVGLLLERYVSRGDTPKESALRSANKDKGARR